MPPADNARIRLLESMLDAIWEHSYGSMSVDAICERADVRKGSFYHFFPSKAALAGAALDHLWETSTRPALERIFSPDRTPVERVERLLADLYERTVACREERGRVLGCPYFHIAAETSSIEPEPAERARVILGRFQGYLEETLAEAAAAGCIRINDPAFTAAAVFSLIEGCWTHARIHDDPERVHDLNDVVGRILGIELQPFATTNRA